MDGLQIVASVATSGIATAAVKHVKESQNEPFDKATDQIKLDMPALFTDKSTTTTTTTYSNTRFIERTADSAVIQQFFIQDTNQGMNVSIFYDRLFGTYVFVPHAEGTGFIRDTRLQNLPTVIWKLDRFPRDGRLSSIPEDVQRRLDALNAARLKPADARIFRLAAEHRHMRLASDIRRTDDGWPTATVATDPESTGRAQALYVAEDHEGRDVVLCRNSANPKLAQFRSLAGWHHRRSRPISGTLADVASAP